jgi:broad specificity phosphatase PhoE
VTAVSRIAREDETSGNMVVVSHGGVGCLLAAHLQKVEIGRESRPSHPGGGCFIVLHRETFTLQQDWRAIEDGFAV